MEKPKPGLAMSKIPVKPRKSRALRGRVTASFKKMAARI